MENIFDNLAKKIYELFVVNPYAIAIQQDDGKYITKYIPYDHSLLKGMFEKKVLQDVINKVLRMV